MSLIRILLAAVLLCASTVHAAVINPSSLSGLWYNPAQAGQGFTFSFDEEGRVAVTWYVYDDQGNQVWLIGSGAIVGNRAELPVVITSGGLFPPLFDPTQVTRTPWGTLTLDILDCDRINARWTTTTAGFTDGNFDVVPLIVSGGLQCQITQADDVGDSCDEATPIASSGTFNGSIDPESDEDFFRVTLGSSGLFRARSVRQGELDPTGTILDANCDVVIEGDDSAVDQNFDIDTLLSPGVYYVKVASFGAGSRGNYALNLSFEAGVSDDFPDDCSPATTVAPTSQTIGRIDELEDEDYVSVVLNEAGILTASSSGTATLDPIGAVLDANCELIAENDDDQITQNFLIRVALQAGTYYVKVRSYAQASSGVYTLNLNFAPGSGTADDHGNICGTASAVTANGSATGNIEIAGDEDFFRFTIQDRGTLTFGTSGISSLDPEVAVFDQNCDRVAEDDDGGLGRNSLISLPLDGGNVWYVRVRAWQASSEGTYTIQPRFTPSVPGTDDHGNACSSATLLAPNYSAIGRIEPGADADFFRFELETEGTFTVNSVDSNSLDPVGALLDANCNVLAENDDSNDGDFSVSTDVTTGVYYLRVTSLSGSSDDYQLDFGYSAFAGASQAAASKSTTAPKAAPLEMDSSLARAWQRSKPPRASPKAVLNASALTGLWYDPAGDGQGFSLSFNQSGTVAIAWYVYANTRQVWLVGSGDVIGNRAVVQMFIAEGARFPPDFDPNDVELTPWGTITLDFRACDDIRVSWTSTLPGFSTGTLNAIPLIVAGGLTCEVTPDVDDAGNSCATAAAATLNASTSGRIDPAADEDYFRFTVGSTGTYSVQSGGSTTLNPRAALLDASCAVLAENDDASGREFALTRELAAGTYYLRVASSASGSVGDYAFASSFATTPGGSTQVSLQLENELLYDIEFRANGGEPIRVSAGTSRTEAVAVTGSLGVTFALVGAVNQAGAPAGDLLGGSFDPVSSPSGTIRYTVTNEIGAQTYFAPVIGNKSFQPVLIGVNMGTPDENLCNCIVPVGARDARVGYYELGVASNVRGYFGATTYSGNYVVWGSDPSGAGRQLLPVPLNSIVQSPSGRATLQAIQIDIGPD